MASKKTFESAINELEKIVNELENSDADLDKTIALFDKGMKLASFCRGKLDVAENKVKTLANELASEPEFKDFKYDKE